MVAMSRRSFLFAILVVSACLAISCRGRGSQAQQPEPSPPAPTVEPMAVEPEQKDPPLARTYRVIIIEPFESSAEISSTYPEVIRQCHEATIKALENLNVYDLVSDVAPPGLSLRETLKVKSQVTDMRQVQMWKYRRYAGSSYMQVDLELVDGETGATVREKQIESYNNPWVAKWSDSDATLPIDVAGILAGYIHSVIPR